MKKFFEEPEIECIKITSEVITDTEAGGGVIDGNLSLEPNPFPDIP